VEKKVQIFDDLIIFYESGIGVCLYWNSHICNISIMTRRKIILISSLYLFGLIVTVTIVHEIGHIAAALVIGVPLNEISIGLYGINPSVTIPERFAASNLSLLYYAGGFTPAIILIIIYLIYWYRRFRRVPSKINWLMGLITITIAGFQLAQGYNEGRFHAAYIYYASSLFDILEVLICLVLIAAILIHFALFPISNLRRT